MRHPFRKIRQIFVMLVGNTSLPIFKELLRWGVTPFSHQHCLRAEINGGCGAAEIPMHLGSSRDNDPFQHRKVQIKRI